MLKTFRAIGAVALLLVVNGASVYSPSQPPHQLYNEDDLKLESGEVIKNFSISYVTHGTLNAKKSNAILMVTAISGNHHRLDFTIGRGKALDRTNISSSRPMPLPTGRPAIRPCSRACHFQKSPSATWWNRDIACWRKNSASTSRRGRLSLAGRHAGAANGVSAIPI